MWNEPSESELAALPILHANENTRPQNVVIHMHLFLGGCDWYLAAYHPLERIFYGYAILNNDFDNAEWGYVALDELRTIRLRSGTKVDRDLNWRPRKASQVDRICLCEGWPRPRSS